MKHLRSLPASLVTTLGTLGTALYLHTLAVSEALGFGGSVPDFGGGTDIRVSTKKIINAILMFLGLAAVIVVLYGGFLILTAAGNEENVTKGRKAIIFALIGIVVIFLASAIVNALLANI